MQKYRFYGWEKRNMAYVVKLFFTIAGVVIAAQLFVAFCMVGTGCLLIAAIVLLIQHYREKKK